MKQRKLLLPVMAASLLVLLIFQLLVSHSPSLAGAGMDIVGPVGSVNFGQQAYALPNGNIVVVDPGFNGNAGAVYLYDGATRAFISTLTDKTSERTRRGRVAVKVTAIGPPAELPITWVDALWKWSSKPSRSRA